MSGPHGISCGTCVFVDMSNLQQPFCRRYPPTLVVVRTLSRPTGPPTDNGVRKFFPVVDPMSDWCGEHSSGTAAEAGTTPQ